jgi:hypothetical protein
MQSYRDLYTSFEMAKGVYQGLLSMAIDKHMISITEANRMNQQLYEIRRDQQFGQEEMIENPPKYAFILDRSLAIRDGRAALVDSMIDRFEELTIFNEFTTGSSDISSWKEKAGL